MKQDRKFDSHIAEHAHDVKIAKLRLGMYIIGGIFLFVVIVAAFAVSLAGDVRKSFPDYWDRLRSLGIDVQIHDT